MISNDAIAAMTRSALRIGFSERKEEYSWSDNSVVSAGDYKGESMAVVVFAFEDEAKAWVDEMQQELVCGGSELLAEVFQFPIQPDWTEGFGCIAVLRAIDIWHKSEMTDD